MVGLILLALASAGAADAGGDAGAADAGVELAAPRPEIQLSPAEMLLPRWTEVDTAVVVFPDGGTLAVVGGLWLRKDTAIEAARRETSETTETTALEHATIDSSTEVVGKALVAFFVLGLVAGVAIDRWMQAVK